MPSLPPLGMRCLRGTGKPYSYPPLLFLPHDHWPGPGFVLRKLERELLPRA